MNKKNSLIIVDNNVKISLEHNLLNDTEKNSNSISDYLTETQSEISLTEKRSNEEEKFKTLSLTENTFRDLNIFNAVVKYLEMVGQIQTIPEIAKALIAGGYQTKSKKFYDNVRPVLIENEYPKGRKSFYREKRGWGLADWVDH